MSSPGRGVPNRSNLCRNPSRSKESYMSIERAIAVLILCVAAVYGVTHLV